jgi:hypothetical protein
MITASYPVALPGLFADTAAAVDEVIASPPVFVWMQSGWNARVAGTAKAAGASAAMLGL